MTVSTQSAVVEYIENGVTLTFDVPFRFLAATDLIVERIQAGAVSSVSPASVTGAGDDNGGTVTLSSSVSGAVLRIRRRTERVQPTNYTPNDDFPAESHERALDRQMLALQETDADVTALQTRALLVPDGDTAPALPDLAANAGKVLGIGPGKTLVPVSQGGADSALRSDLADPTAGALLVAFRYPGAGTATRDVQKKLEELNLSVRDRGAVGDYDSDNGTGTDDTEEIQAAFDQQDASSVGAFEVTVPRGNYLISGSDTQMIQVQGGLGVRGTGTLEGSYFWVDPDATAPVVFQDDGNAAKTEIGHITINCQNNSAIDAIFQFGLLSVPLGTYGRFDNLMARNAPNATAYNFFTNIMAVGVLNSIDTRDGVVNADGAVGLLAQAIYPVGFPRYGIKQSLGDVTVHTELEAPGASAIPIFQNRGGIVLTAIISQAPGTANKRLASYNPTYKGGIDIGHLTVIQSGGSCWGDFDNPPTAGSGTATGVGTNTLTDATKDWALNQWQGCWIKIMSGTGAGTKALVESNTNNTITLTASDWVLAGTAPASGSGYAIDFAVHEGSEVAGVWTRAASKAGQGVALNGLNMFRGLFRRLRAAVAEFNQARIGSRGSLFDQVIGLAATVDFASIAANSVGTAVDVAVPGVVAGGKWSILVTMPATPAAQGFVVTPTIPSADVVRLIPKNLTGSAIDPGSATLIIEARRFV